MGLVFLVLKVFPVFGISLSVLCFDLARDLKRKGNKAWIGIILLSVIMMVLTGLWVYFRGDRHADLWFGRLLEWFGRR
jgi:hypothetical protein